VEPGSRPRPALASAGLGDPSARAVDRGPQRDGRARAGHL